MLDQLRIATRESALAMWQANDVRERIKAAFPDLEVVICGMTTEGDRNKSSPLARIGGKGVFVKELEQALLSGTAEIAVHSMKDVPAESPPGSRLARSVSATIRATPSSPIATLRSATCRKDHGSAHRACVVGCSFRKCSLDLVFPELRGNVDTRLKKLDDGSYEAIILATAGLNRLDSRTGSAKRSIHESAFRRRVRARSVSSSHPDNDEVREILSQIDDAANVLACSLRAHDFHRSWRDL
ncbi:MAG: hydroxymethylbilane synthase [Gammaproteobacteria bacterium]|nr:hydroxymethylbilane synthase [Gammaproteobacteria bacterium]